MISEEMKETISSVVSELNEMDVNLYYIRSVLEANQKERLELLRDLITEIKHLRYAVDRVGR